MIIPDAAEQPWPTLFVPGSQLFHNLGMTRTPTLILLMLALVGTAAAASHKPAHHPVKHESKPARPACVPDEPSFWKDQALATKVAATLPFHKALLREKVQVKVTGGAAALSGNVSSQAAIDEAVRVVAGVSGVKCVQNFLHVGPPLPEAPQQQP